MFPDPLPKSKLQIAVDTALEELLALDAASAEAAKITDQVVKLHKMKEDEKPSRVSKDTMALIGANLTGTVLIIMHERVHIITSKALNLVLKPR